MAPAFALQVACRRIACHPTGVTALEKPEFLSIEKYLAGEELAETKHDYDQIGD